MEEAKVKRIRSGNMTPSEKAVLADLCVKYGDVIECKATDGASKVVKATAWNQLCAEFNAQTTTGVRTVVQLKHVCHDRLFSHDTDTGVTKHLTGRTVRTGPKYSDILH